MRLIDADALLNDPSNITANEFGDDVVFVEDINKAPTVELSHETCKTCKYYVPYKDQFLNRPRGDGYCNSNITALEGNAFINCHDEWYCANYEKEGETE